MLRKTSAFYYQSLENNFHLSSDQASDQLLANSHLLREEICLIENSNEILQLSSSRFLDSQVSSVLSFKRKVAEIEGSTNLEQQKLIDAIEQYFAKIQKKSAIWA